MFYWGDYLAVLLLVGVASFLAGWTAYGLAEHKDKKKVKQQDIDSYIDLMWREYKERYDKNEKKHKSRGIDMNLYYIVIGLALCLSFSLVMVVMSNG
jgi:tetrahydromethanopterin S-methyltransferase subunit G